MSVSIGPYPSAVNNSTQVAQPAAAVPISINLPHIAPQQSLHKMAKALQGALSLKACGHEQLLQVDSSSSSGSSLQVQPGMESRAVAVGFAVNGAKASAHAVAHAKQPVAGGMVAALADATATANHASKAVAVAKSGASNRVVPQHGTTVAATSAEALADHLSTATADSGSLAMGLGGASTSATTATRSAATDGSRSDVAGTAVSSAVGHGSTAHVVSDATGSAEKHSMARTNADSITVAIDGNKATGSAVSSVSAEKRGAAVSHSLMESFSLFNSTTDANSLATARGSHMGLAASRDKAVGIGLWSGTAATNTTTQVVSAKLGLAVITSVVRSITAQGRFACADAVRRAGADLLTGPQLNINDVTLHLENKVPQQCLTSYKDLAVKSLAKELAVPGRWAVDQQATQGQDFARVKSGVQAGVAPHMQAAEAKLLEVLGALSKGKAIP